jgi:hypothetical protein
LEQASEQDAQGAETMQVENNNREVASIPRSVHWNIHAIPRFETRHV